MQFQKTELNEVVIGQPKVHSDDRGYFMESFRLDLWEDFLGLKLNFCQDNESQSQKGVFRGLHFQLPPKTQSKLVRVIKGVVCDIVVDIRRGSPQFGKFVKIILSEENKRQLFIPRGFAHGFLVLSESCIFSYKVDNYYDQQLDSGIHYLDEEIGIDWPDEFPRGKNMTVSEKDIHLPKLEDCKDLFDYGENYY